MKKTKKYAITTASGAVINTTTSKKKALELFLEQGYKIKISDIYLYN